MNKKIFDDEVGRQISPTWRVNVKLMAEWFEWILKRLENQNIFLWRRVNRVRQLNTPERKENGMRMS